MKNMLGTLSFSKHTPLGFPIENELPIPAKRTNIYPLKVILQLFQERISMQFRMKN